ncbi:MAG TPA: nodulation protein NfeD [Candidatus Binataceae bacterium]|nr:nodulation protein NfeD [Candidatus Binataceae bacterium]
MARRFPSAKDDAGAMRRSLPLAMALGALALTLLVFGAHARAGGGASGSVVVIAIDSSINPATADFVEESIDAAARQNARALIIELDTPGGLLSTTRRIVKDVMGAPIPVIVYVAPSGASAASAGTFITIAASLAAMAPGTTIGAAHPLEMGGMEEKGVAATKMESFAASFARTIAEQRGRNPDWVEKAVRQSASIGDRDALRLHVVEIIARDLPDLLSQANGRQVSVGGRMQTLNLAGAPIERREMTLKERVIDKLSDPNIVYLLLMAGVVGLYFEFAHPGVYAPGVIGVICLLLALMSFQILPINNTGLLLLLVGIGLLTAEVFTPSHGVLGLGGVISFVLGSLFLVDTSQTNLVVSRGAIAGVTIGLVIGMAGLAWAMAQRRKPALTGREGLVGEVGEIRQPVKPGAAGWIFIHGEMWRATSDQPLDIGAPARVKAIRGMELEVQGLAERSSRSSA